MKTLEQMKNSPKDNFPEYIIIHCSDSDVDDFKSIQNYHLSKGWENIGYQKVIERTGLLVQGRPETYHGSHTLEQGMNAKSVGICICGRFENKLPNDNQIKTLKEEVSRLMSVYNIPVEKIKYHRHFKPSKTCPGMAIKDDWVKNLVSQPVESEMTLEEAKAKLLAIKKILEL